MDVLEQDYLNERRRKWRRSAFWRGFLVAAVLGLIIGGLSLMDTRGSQPHIARILINDVIYDDLKRAEFLNTVARSEAVEAVIVHINSPGGTAAGSEALYDSLRSIAEEKPMVAAMGEVAASGGYIAALAADHIVARGNTATGSIGVIMEYPDVTGLMDRVGVEMVTMRSSDLKSGPSPFRPISPEVRAAEQEMIADSYAWFRDLVGERRNLSGPALTTAADGRVFTGRQALEAGLIDALGGEAIARAHLESVSETLSDLEVVTWEYGEDDGLMSRLLSRIEAFSTGFGASSNGTWRRPMAILN